MESLPQETLDQVRKLLDQREKDLVTDVAREQAQKSDYGQLAAESPDTGDSSFADLSTDLDNAAIGRDVIELRAIGRARERIANGSYGTCIDCEQAIPVERLLAQPIAERCAHCQQVYENTHATGGRGATL